MSFREGQIVLFAFPQTDLALERLRPALILRELPGNHRDWLVCMISSQLHHCIEGFDEVISSDESFFVVTGLRTTSLVRLSRLAVVSTEILAGTIGSLGDDRMQVLRKRLSDWIASS